MVTSLVTGPTVFPGMTQKSLAVGLPTEMFRMTRLPVPDCAVTQGPVFLQVFPSTVL